MNTKLSLFLTMLFIGLGLMIFPTISKADTSSPYDVPSSVKSGWNDTFGGKDYSMTSGKDLVYDVYKSKYGGYQIVNKDFGKGEQPYIVFHGWAVLFGYKTHTLSNNDTYIVAQKTKGDSGVGTQKIYSTVTRNISATEDLEYNNQGSGVYNECSSSDTNKRNDDCNMRYDGVGFDAYIPFNDLFSDRHEKSSWKLYLVKKVDDHIVYTSLVVPFDLDHINYNGGDIRLDSGINNKKLTMNSEQVLRRSKPRESASSVQHDLGSDRYFTQGKSYTEVDEDETQTAVWYGVKSPDDNNKTKWATTSYWTFSGDQAELSFTPNNPPVADWSYSPTTVYNDTTVTFTNKSSDPDGDSLTYKWEVKPYGSDSSNYVTFSTSKTPSPQTFPKGHYTVKLTVSDGSDSDSLAQYITVGNRDPVVDWSYSPTTVYNDTSITFTNKSNDLDGDDLTYKWERKPYGSDSSNYVTFSTSKTPAPQTLPKGHYTVKLTVSDGEDSESLAQYILVENRPPVADFSFSDTSVYNDTTVTTTNKSSDPDGDSLTYKWEVKPYGSDDSNYTTLSTSKTLSKTFDKGHWTVRLTVSDGEDSSSVQHDITVNNRQPNANFSYSPTTIYNDTTVTFSNSSSDPDGDTLTYKWEYQKPNSTTWTTFSTDKNPTYVLNDQGNWNIRLTVSDGTTTDSVTKTITVQNRQPSADFSYSPTTVYNDTTVTFTNKSSDPDGDTLTYKWEYQKPYSVTWTTFSTDKNPTFVLNLKGDWNIRLTVSDGITTDSVTKTITVQNRQPNADFSYSPTTIYNDTTVTFTNKSNDPDGDTLTYKWSYQKPNSTTWTTFSTDKSPTYVLNTQGNWNIRLTISDGVLSDSITKTVTVQNRQPNADFSYSPTTIYNDTTVTFTNKSNDPDGDTLTYKWEYQKPNSTTWTTFSTTKNPTYVLSQKGDWNIRLTVSDGTTTDSVTKTITTQNRQPSADFSYSPTTIYNDTTVTFTNKSSDPDGDTLTYKWSYQKPNSTTWTDFSTDKNPSKVLNVKGTWAIRLVVTDDDGSTATKIENPIVQNRKPIAQFEFDKSTYYEGDSYKVTSTSSDPDGDSLTYKYTVTDPDGETSTFSTANFTSEFSKSGDYKVTLTVTDTMNESSSVTKTMSVQALEIKGFVNHTDNWKKIHDEEKHLPSDFYSGEKFLVSASVTDYPIEYVKVDFRGNQIDNVELDIEKMLNLSNNLYSGEVYDSKMADPTTKLMNGNAYLLFTAKWKNGTIKQDLVTIQIIDDVYGAYQLHRTN